MSDCGVCIGGGDYDGVAENLPTFNSASVLALNEANSASRGEK